MIEIICTGTPREIGLKHGTQAQVQIKRCIQFYANQFLESAKLDWDQVRDLATSFRPIIEQKWSAYLEEMDGIAQAAGVETVDIIALNVRTEITFGCFTDGCTALSWRSSSHSFLAQNWDWMEEQKENLIRLTIQRSDRPSIQMITEAGIIGKIGCNSAGVGVCLNAIRAKGMDRTKLPCHLGLRMVLESASRDEAVARLEEYGIASSCHMLVADGLGSVGLEWSSTGLERIEMDDRGRIFHTNHYLARHEGVEDSRWLADSAFRATRIVELADGLPGSPSLEQISSLFVDEENYPAAICRAQVGSCQSATLFNIVMDLAEKHASVRFGRPSSPEETFQLGF